jgi:hypothetical protein
VAAGVENVEVSSYKNEEIAPRFIRLDTL